MTDADRIYESAARGNYPAWLYVGRAGLNGWQERLRVLVVPCSVPLALRDRRGPRA